MGRGLIRVAKIGKGRSLNSYESIESRVFPDPDAFLFSLRKVKEFERDRVRMADKIDWDSATSDDHKT